MTLEKTLENLLTKFGAIKNPTLKQALIIIRDDLVFLKKELKGPNKVVATKFLVSCEKCSNTNQLLSLIAETMFKLEGFKES